MRRMMESITYMIASLATFSLLTSLQRYWINLSMWIYILLLCILSITMIVYVSAMLKRDQDAWIKTVYILGIPLIISPFVFHNFLAILFITLISGIAGYSTYYNYYHIPEYAASKIREQSDYQYRLFVDNWIPTTSVESYLFSESENLYYALRKLKKEMDNGNIQIIELNDHTIVVGGR